MAVASEVNHDQCEVKLFSPMYSRVFLREDQQSKKLVIYVLMRKVKLHIKRYASDRSGFYGNITAFRLLQVLSWLHYSWDYLIRYVGVVLFNCFCRLVGWSLNQDETF